MTDEEIYEYLGESFVWNKAKAAGNFWKHGVRFTEAATVFFDRFAIYERDPDHSLEEEHLIIIGRSAVEHMLAVVHVYRGERTRIISARRPTASERRQYAAYGS